MRKRNYLLLFLVCSTLFAGLVAQSKATKPALKPVSAKADTFTLPPRAAGNKDAPITLEVFSDFQCPGCRELYLRSLRRVIDEYCATGKVYLLHHDFPLPQHKYSGD